MNAMDIEIPSPSVFLRRTPSPVNKLIQAEEKTRNTRKEVDSKDNQADRPAVPRRNTQERAGERGVTKPKQSKSRNGCITCKKKRLKCDETKPSCAQCQKRGVECEGYKIAYKWRTFEELNSSSRAGAAKNAKNTKSKKDAFTAASTDAIQVKNAEQSAGSTKGTPTPTRPASRDEKSPVSPVAGVFAYPVRANVPETPTSLGGSTIIQPSPFLKLGFGLDDMYNELESHSFLDYNALTGELETHDEEQEQADEDDNSFLFSDPSLIPPSALEDLDQTAWLNDPALDTSIIMPHAVDDDSPTPDQVSNDHEHTMSEVQPSSAMVRGSRQPMRDSNIENTRLSDLVFTKTPALDLSSPEMLMLRFDRETCGVLSIKDGMYENPWRTLIWPLAKDSEPLYHAIMAMSALHGSGVGAEPQLRLTGVSHLTKSLTTLSNDLAHMTLEQGLATTLALALAEAWDDKITTGIHHLQGARFLLQRALDSRNRSLQNSKDGAPLRFLANTYIYLEAIGRLTSAHQPRVLDLEYLLHATAEPTDADYEVDPLLGCGANLFPLLGQVAQLVNQIRGTQANSLKMISEANEIKERLLDWEPCDVTLFIPPEDPTSNVRHALHTAEAYRRATLLHLDQAIPESATESPYDQAKGILTALAAVPISSRTLNIQIFPLLVGSCEMVDEDDRQWVKSRWQAMMQRLTLMNVSACWRVVREVWRRRDERVQANTGRFSQNGTRESTRPGTGNTDGTTFRQQGAPPPRGRGKLSPMDTPIDYTVRGQLHWLGVMSDWAWEVFL